MTISSEQWFIDEQKSDRAWNKVILLTSQEENCSCVVRKLKIQTWPYGLPGASHVIAVRLQHSTITIKFGKYM